MMFPAGSRLLFGATVLTALAATLYGVTNGGSLGTMGLISAAVVLPIGHRVARKAELSRPDPAADRFYIGEADAGPAILLPSPRISPHASPRAAKGKGKARADARATPDADSSGLLRVRGKEQELDAARDAIEALTEPE